MNINTTATGFRVTPTTSFPYAVICIDCAIIEGKTVGAKPIFEHDQPCSCELCGGKISVGDAFFQKSLTIQLTLGEVHV